MRSLPILTFHAVDDAGDVGAFPPGVFRRAIARLHSDGFRTVDLADAVAGLRRGDPLPDRAVVLTFDDGYRSAYTDAFPVLQEHGMTATVFLAVGARDGAGDGLPSLTGREMLAWNEIREMAGAGIAFGAHTLSHADLTALDPDRIEAEVLGSRTVIEQRLGVPVPGFAYPFGRFDTRSRAVVRRCFDFACSDVFSLVTHASDPWALERIDMLYFRGPRRVGLVTSAWLPVLVPAIAAARRIRRRALAARG